MTCISWRLNDPINFVEVRGTSVLTNNQPGNGAPSNSPENSSEKPKDFDDSANPLWSLYEKEARNHDEAQIQTLKDDMDDVLIFVCIYVTYPSVILQGQSLNESRSLCAVNGSGSTTFFVQCNGDFVTSKCYSHHHRDFQIQRLEGTIRGLRVADKRVSSR